MTKLFDAVLSIFLGLVICFIGSYMGTMLAISHINSEDDYDDQ